MQQIPCDIQNAFILRMLIRPITTCRNIRMARDRPINCRLAWKPMFARSKRVVCYSSPFVVVRCGVDLFEWAATAGLLPRPAQIEPTITVQINNRATKYQSTPGAWVCPSRRYATFTTGSPYYLSCPNVNNDVGL